MKRAIFIAAALFCAAQFFCAAPAFAQNGTIAELTGTVEIKPAGAADFAAAKAGDAVASSTIVSTGFKSTALIRVGSAVLTVRPLTRLSLLEISAASGAETINVNLQTGRVKVDVNPPAGTRTSMSVTSPIATASVRGTSFEFDTQSLNVLEGTVAFSGSGGQTMMVSAGSSSNIGADGSPLDPMTGGPASLLPPPPAGREAGYRRNASIPSGEIVFVLELK